MIADVDTSNCNITPQKTGHVASSNVVQPALFDLPAAPKAPRKVVKRRKSNIIPFSVPIPDTIKGDPLRREDTANLIERVEISFLDLLLARRDVETCLDAIDDNPLWTPDGTLDKNLTAANARLDDRTDVLSRHWQTAQLGGILSDSLLFAIIERLVETPGLICSDYQGEK